MATEAPDPRTFTSWEDAFNYPVPVVRKLEAQLRANATDNRERLRSLVGASYRDLLGTAERIVEMDQTMGQVDMVLGQVGRRCNSGVVDKTAINFSKLEAHWRSQKQDKNAFASQLAMLQTCPTIISRQLKKDGSPLMAAKILVLSRLLHKNLSQLPHAPPLVDRTRDQLLFLRRRLLSRIHRQCSDPAVDQQVLIDSMCAHSLATSSTPSDVLKHFQAVRLEAINSQFEHGSDLQEQILRALNLCVRTLQDSQAIFPRQLSQSLFKLKASPLLQTSDIQNVAELNLNVHERWIADEVRNYTPWPRHDELQKADAERISKAWARQAIDAFIAGLDRVLSRMTDLRSVVKLRQDILETWFPASSKAPGLDPQRVLDDIRNALNKQIKVIAQNDISNLRSVTNGIQLQLKNWNGQAATTAPLWELGSDNIDLNNGAAVFKHAINERSRGRTHRVTTLIDTYTSWSDSLVSIRRVVKEMKDMRWDDDFDEEEEDELDLDSKQTLLSEDDPSMLEDTLKESLAAAFSQLREDLSSIANSIVSSPEEVQPGKAIFVLRVLREISQRMAAINTGTSSSKDLVSFPETAVESLHRILADFVISTPKATYESSLQRTASRKTVPGRLLWEGSPPLPSQPSPTAYKLLDALSRSMARIGGDLWSPGAVRTLKNLVRDPLNESLSASMKDAMEQGRARTAEKETSGGDISGLSKNDDNSDDTENQDDTANNENADKEATSSTPKPNSQAETSTPSAKQGLADSDSEQLIRDKITQLLFDYYYINNALATRERSSQFPLSPTNATELAISGLVKDALSKNAEDYWRRTYLMFALLA